MRCSISSKGMDLVLFFQGHLRREAKFLQESMLIAGIWKVLHSDRNFVKPLEPPVWWKNETAHLRGKFQIPKNEREKIS